MKAQERVQILMDSISRERVFPREQRQALYSAVVDGLLKIAQLEEDRKGKRFCLEPVGDGFGIWLHWQQAPGIQYGEALLAAGRDGRHLRICRKQKARELCLIYQGCYIAEAGYDSGTETISVYKITQILEEQGGFKAGCERVYVKGQGGVFCSLEDREFEILSGLIEAAAGLAAFGKAPGWPL